MWQGIPRGSAICPYHILDAPAPHAAILRYNRTAMLALSLFLTIPQSALLRAVLYPLHGDERKDRSSAWRAGVHE